MPKPKEGYEVGYGKPPAAHQFRKGKSGNPFGRPKKKPGIVEMVQRVMNEKVPITLNGRRRMVTSIEAAFHVVRTKGISGDLKAIRFMQTLIDRYEAGNVAEPLSSDKDLAILEDILSRAATYGAASGEGSDSE
jgi:hypothetical protein